MITILIITATIEIAIWAASRFASILARPSRRLIRARMQAGL